ncbi:MAG: tRNA (N(6)-L-threonylcarbamoyladenosine(37)-C(2))-methylthiotransferase [Candidatus Bathyarchaeota archaeon]|nr:tRNA (N(6)-L-threonylcarbamoyladenosine(37)-C(2))-methylthiotransferase [Candidatus Bathyarchaeota archaeon]
MESWHIARVYVEAYGCSANLADSEIVQGLLWKAGHTIVGEPGSADASVVLSCTVKTPTQKKIEKRIRELHLLGPPLIVAGCMPKAQRDLVADIAPGASMIGPDNIREVVRVVGAAIIGESMEALEGGRPDKTGLPRIRENPVVHIAPIASGCLGSCSYCIVKQARGGLTSFPAEAIVDNARTALVAGCREIWVTAEDTAAYHWKGVGLPKLLGRLADLPGRYFIRVGMMTPSQAKPILDPLIEAYHSDKVFKFLHVPAQSGSDEVLGRMGRRYTVKEYRELVQRFKEGHPLASISTDIICGFPGETESQFEESIKLVEQMRPDVLNISRFWPRPGTEAASMEGQLHGRITKKRSRLLSGLWRDISLEANLRWVGWEGKALVDEPGRSGGMMARNFAYKPIVIKDPVRVGDSVKIRITEALRGYLIGETT